MDLFFLLSGYVLSRRFASGMPDTTDFVALRFKRLWPPIATGVLIGAPLFWFLGMPLTGWLWQLAGGLLIVPIGGMILFNGPAWSIHFELWANLLHALVLKALSPRSLAAIVAVCAAVILLGLSDRSLENMGQGSGYAYGFPRVILSYTLGMLVWKLNGERTFGNPAAGWVALGAYIVLLANFPGWMRPIGELVVVILVHPLLIMACQSIRRSRVAMWLGAFSFPLYAIHYPVMLGGIALKFDARIAFVAAVAAAGVVGLAIDPQWRGKVIGLYKTRSRAQEVVLEPA